MTSFRVFGLPHLSEDAVAAYADGVLQPAAMMRAEKHCFECPECAEAVRIQREAVTMLRNASAPSLPSGLMARLNALPSSTPMPPPMGGLPTAIGDDGVPVFVSHHHAAAHEQQRNAIPGPIPGPIGGLGGHAPMTPPRDGRTRMRSALPVGMIASAAAVLGVTAVGTMMSGAASEPQRRAPALVVPIVQASYVGSTPTPTPRTPRSAADVAPFSIVGVGKTAPTP